MMLDLKTLGQHTNCRSFSRRQTVYRQQRLVLMRLDTSFPGCAFAEIQKPPDFIAKIA